MKIKQKVEVHEFPALRNIEQFIIPSLKPKGVKVKQLLPSTKK